MRMLSSSSSCFSQRWFCFIVAIITTWAFHVKVANGVASTSRFQVHIPASLSKPEGYDHRDALFGIPPYGGSIQQQVYYADDDLCSEPVDKTKGYPKRVVNPRTGKQEPWKPPYILMIDRGDCTFVTKVRNAQRAGAAGVLVADNQCMCESETCVVEPGQICQEVEPVMGDDGSGQDISIPAFLLFKQDAEPIKEALLQNQHVRVEMSFSLPQEDRVEYTFWTLPKNEIAAPFEKSNFVAAVEAFGKQASLTPHMCIYDGIEIGCMTEGGEDKCYNLCTNNGRYCAADPDNNLDKGISGADLVVESLRRLCIWKKYGQDGIGVEWWSYVKDFTVRCELRDSLFSDASCITTAMQSAGIDEQQVQDCMAESGGLEGNVTNTILQQELESKETNGIFLIPSLYVNDAPVRGEFEFVTIFKALCAGFATGHRPDICQTCSTCRDHEVESCVDTGICKNGETADGSTTPGVSTHVFVFSLLGITLIFVVVVYIQYQRQQRYMHDQVRGIMAEYMPLDVNNNNPKPTMTSLSLEEESGADSSFT